MSDFAQQMVAKRDYDAFGNLISSTGTWGSAFGHAGGFGYQEDATGLKLLGHRYFDSSTGRFLTRDPIKDGRNWYSYGAGEANPVTEVDPTGLTSINTPAGRHALSMYYYEMAKLSGTTVGSLIMTHGDKLVRHHLLPQNVRVRLRKFLDRASVKVSQR
ncbi:MAG: RHS repeat-associated core domain-containing protein [Fimbriimonadaceae bacterium]|jgi:RHS repeat-associated protein|nr:RHS repeat-associated core domain-containing protein [Fimbriimonadaceae bacterium]